MQNRSFRHPVHTLLFIAMLMLSSALPAQTALWKNRLNGSGDNTDRYNAVVSDGLGNFYLTGYTNEPGAGKDFLTVKLNASGDTVWTRKYNGPESNDDEANFIVIDALGNITVSGYSDGGSTLTKNDILTMQYSPSGVLLWSQLYNYTFSNEDEFPAAMAVDASNNIFITGRSDHDANNVDDIITLKYSAAGIEQWVMRYDGGGSDRGAGIVADNAGGCVLTGRTANALNDDVITLHYSATGTITWSAIYAGPGGDDRGQAVAKDAAGNYYVGATASNGSDDDFLSIKYSSTGTQLWTKIADGGDNDRVTTIKADALGNVFVTGQTDMATGGSTDYDFRTIKYNTSGVQQFNVTTGNPVGQEDTPSELYIDASGNLYITGKSDAIGGGNVDFEFMTAKLNASGLLQWIRYYNGTTANAEDIPSGVITDATGNVWVSGSVDLTATQKDAAFIKYSSAGVFTVAKTFNGSGDFTDKARAITTDASNNIYITGYTMSSGKQRDVLVEKMSSAGVTLWSKTYNGTDENDEGMDIATDAAGNVFIAGYTNGSGTFDDGLLMKFNSLGAPQFTIIYNDVASQLDKFISLAVSAAGDIYVTGYSDGDPSDLISNYDIITIKYNALGLQQWVNRFNGIGNGIDKPEKLILLGNNIYVTGTTFNGSNNDIITLKYNTAGTLLSQNTYAGVSNGDDAAGSLFGTGTAIYMTGSEFVTGNADDYVTIKYDTSLVQLWKKNYNGTGDAIDEATGISATATDVYVTGNSAGPASLNDIALVRYNASTGAQLWVKRYTSGGAVDDEAYSVVTDNLGNIYTAGKTGSPASIYDYVALNYNTAGTKLLTLKYNGTGNGEDVAKQAKLDANGYLYITGYSKGTGNTGYDFTTVKYCTPLPDAVITAAGATTICIGDSLALNANIGAGLTYQWKKGNANITGATNSVYYAKSNGAYKVVVANTNGCTKTSNVINVSAIACRAGDIAEADAIFNIAVQPNPFTSEAVIDLISDEEMPAEISVYDIAGQLVEQVVLPAGTYTVAIGADLIPGAYMIRVQQGDRNSSAHLIKISQ